MTMPIGSIPKKWSFMEEKLFCMYGGLTMELFIFSEALDADLYSQKLQRVHENLSPPVPVNRRYMVLLYNNTRIMQEKYLT